MTSILTAALASQSASLAKARRAPACAAWLGVNEANQARVCAWCPANAKAQAETRAARLGMDVTHSICDDCRAEELRALLAA